jgi:hypothetical protein
MRRPEPDGRTRLDLICKNHHDQINDPVVLRHEWRNVPADLMRRVTKDGLIDRIGPKPMSGTVVRADCWSRPAGRVRRFGLRLKVMR